MKKALKAGTINGKLDSAWWGVVFLILFCPLKNSELLTIH
jgi:hypothetical protein